MANPNIDTNDFIEKYVDDEIYKKIVSELTTRKKKNKAGRKIKLTSENLRQFLFLVSMGQNLKDSATLSGIGMNTREDYSLRSDTFSELITLAQSNVGRCATLNMARAIMGTKSYYEEIIHPATNKPAYIEVKGSPPDIKASMWWLEVVEKIGGEEAGEQPVLGAPRNDEEKALMQDLLKTHFDYVRQKSKQRSRASES
jgi:hypothetical protein